MASSLSALSAESAEQTHCDAIFRFKEASQREVLFGHDKNAFGNFWRTDSQDGEIWKFKGKSLGANQKFLTKLFLGLTICSLYFCVPAAISTTFKLRRFKKVCV